MPRKDLPLLTLTPKQRQADKKNNITYFKPGSSNQTERLVISNGIFKTNFNVKGCFDSRCYSSHGKRGYAAFTMDTSYNMRVFPHYFTRNGIAHSSMNDGKALLFAGELQVIQGQLTTITTYSGHYRPSLKSVKYILEYFHNHDVDIQSVWVETFTDLKPYFPQITSQQTKKSDSTDFFRTKAADLFGPMTNVLNSSLKEAEQLLKNQEKSHLTSFFQVKDFFTHSKLTERRNQLRQKTRQTFFSAELTVQTPTQQYSKLQNDLNTLQILIAENAKLSRDFRTKAGRLHDLLLRIKAILDPIYHEAYTEVFPADQATDKKLAQLC